MRLSVSSLGKLARADTLHLKDTVTEKQSRCTTEGAGDRKEVQSV